MPFLRSATVPTSGLRAARARTATLAVACAAVLATVAPSPAHAELTHADTTPVPDAATFCPSPTGRWWDDYAVRGCIELLTGRDHATPITDRELAWLDLGGLPAYATIDPDAIGAAIAAFEQRLAEEAAERTAAEAAEQQRPPRTPRPPGTPIRLPRGPIDAEAISAACGHTFGTAPTPEQGACIRAALESGGPSSAPSPAPTTAWEQSGMDRESYFHGLCLDRVPAPPDSALPGGPERSDHLRAVAECVDREVPGYMTTWLQQQAEWEAWLEEARRKEAEALARMHARRDAAIAEATATCPGAWTVSSPYRMVGSYDEVEFFVTCH